MCGLKGLVCFDTSVMKKPIDKVLKPHGFHPRRGDCPLRIRHFTSPTQKYLLWKNPSSKTKHQLVLFNEPRTHFLLKTLVDSFYFVTDLCVGFQRHHRRPQLHFHQKSLWNLVYPYFIPVWELWCQLTNLYFLSTSQKKNITIRTYSMSLSWRGSALAFQML